MLTIILSLFSSARQAFQTRAALQAEILALRHQLLVLQRSSRGHRLREGVFLAVAGFSLERTLTVPIGARPIEMGLERTPAWELASDSGLCQQVRRAL